VAAEVASMLAYRATQVGVSVDRRLVVTAALLHDIDKSLPESHPLRELGHGNAGAAWLSEAGHPELSRAVAAHPVMRLEEPGAASWVNEAPIEERIVTYADKRATQRVVSLEKRFERWRRKHPEYRERLASALEIARQLESALCRQIGIRPEQVERLRWVEDAMARAQASGAPTIVAASATERDLLPGAPVPPDPPAAA
ncbi:MAG: HD domain-containing protein, partial [Chloroflexota bacterium]